MDIVQDLKRELSMGLRDQLNSRLLPEEAVAISLPGSFGEALVVTDRRVFVLRDRASGLESVCDVFEYPLSGVTGALAVASGTGGCIDLSIAKPVAEPDMARVYFPAYDLSKFQAAANCIAKAVPVVSSAPAATAATAAPGTASPRAADVACPKCGTAADRFAMFCGGCGAQIRQMCSQCGGSSKMESAYCESCGKEMQAVNPSCPRCGTRLINWMGTYCVECGSMLRHSCIACGSPFVQGWKYCATCGRQLGSDRIDPHIAGAAQRRLGQLADADRGQASAETPAASAPAQSPAPAASTPAGNPTAEEYNKRGQQFFEGDQPEDAVRQFEMAVALDPENATFHCNLAVAYDECDRDDEALREYKKTLELAPNDLTALLSLGYMHNENEEPEMAREMWGKILQIAPDSAEAQEARENLRNINNL